MRVKLHELADIFLGYTPSTLGDHTVPVIGIADLQDDLRFDPGVVPPELRERALCAGDIVVAARGTLFKAALIPSGGAVPSMNLIVVRLNQAYRHLSPLLLAYFNDPVFGERIKQGNIAVTGKLCLSPKVFRAVEIELPEPKALQELTREVERSEAEYRQALKALSERFEATRSLVRKTLGELPVREQRPLRARVPRKRRKRTRR